MYNRENESLGGKDFINVYEQELPIRLSDHQNALLFNEEGNSQIVKVTVDNQVHYHTKFVTNKQQMNDSAYLRIKGVRLNHFKIMKHTMEALDTQN